MSYGLGGIAKLLLEDEETVIYEYGNFNWNIPECRNDNRVLDGYITISKQCFQEPEIHQKIKRMPNGKKKLVTKRIPLPTDYRNMIQENLIEINNCSYCWQKDENGIDYMSCNILNLLFNKYQIIGEIPKKIIYFK